MSQVRQRWATWALALCTSRAGWLRRRFHRPRRRQPVRPSRAQCRHAVAADSVRGAGARRASTSSRSRARARRPAVLRFIPGGDEPRGKDAGGRRRLDAEAVTRPSVRFGPRSPRARASRCSPSKRSVRSTSGIRPREQYVEGAAVGPDERRPLRSLRGEPADRLAERAARPGRLCRLPGRERGCHQRACGSGSWATMP